MGTADEKSLAGTVPSILGIYKHYRSQKGRTTALPAEPSGKRPPPRARTWMPAVCKPPPRSVAQRNKLHSGSCGGFPPPSQRSRFWLATWGTPSSASAAGTLSQPAEQIVSRVKKFRRPISLSLCQKESSGKQVK